MACNELQCISTPNQLLFWSPQIKVFAPFHAQLDRSHKTITNQKPTPNNTIVFVSSEQHL